MTARPHHETAVELLQELGLKEYEARSFVALTRVPSATAKECSELSDVPRTRIYDAIQSLETHGLVEVHHSSPKVFRAVSINEAVETLRTRFARLTDDLEAALRSIEPAPSDAEADVVQQIWSLAGPEAITTRSAQLIGDADDEVIMIVAGEHVLTDRLLEQLAAAIDRNVTILLGTPDQNAVDAARDGLAEATVFETGLEWLEASPLADDDTQIGRLLLADRSAILVSTFHGSGDTPRDEQAIYGEGFDNGLVTIARRLMATGLPQTDDPAALDQTD